jgi:hypothetical protein
MRSYEVRKREIRGLLDRAGVAIDNGEYQRSIALSLLVLTGVLTDATNYGDQLHVTGRVESGI